VLVNKLSDYEIVPFNKNYILLFVTCISFEKCKYEGRFLMKTKDAFGLF